MVDIAEVLEDFGIPTVYHVNIPQLEELFRKPVFQTSELTTVNVEAGTFQAYNILLAQGLGKIYYSPERGNIVKIFGPISDFIPIVEDLSMELKE